MRYIQLGGEKRPIRFTVNAIMEFEDLTGLDIMTIEGQSKMESVRNVRALAFVGLKSGFKKEFPNKDVPFSIDDVGDWLDTENIELVKNAFISDSSSAETQEGDSKKK